MLKRRLKLPGKILLALFLLFAAFLLCERWRGQIALANYKKELRAKREKLSPQDFVTPISSLENGASAVWTGVERIQQGRILPGSQPPRMRIMGSGRAIIGFREPFWIENGFFQEGEWVDVKVTNRWEHIAMDLSSNAPVLMEIRAAMARPVFFNELDYAGGPKMKIPHLVKAKTLAQWLSGEIALALHEDRKADATAALRCQIQTPKLMAEDKVLIGELVRCAVAAIARVGTWEALQLENWQDEELAAIQGDWADQHFANSMVAAMERELMSMTITYDQLRASNDETYRMFEMLNLFGTMFESLAGDDESAHESASLWENIPFQAELAEFWHRQIYCRTWRFAWSHQAEQKALSEVYRALVLMREAVTEKSYRTIRPAFEAYEAEEVPGYYDRIRFKIVSLMPTYSKTALRPMRAETDRALCLTAIALNRHALRHGNYPAKLDALVPEFLSAVPVDYMDGQPIKYRLNADCSFTLYSAGDDGEDNGGDLTLPEGSKSRDLWRRKDYVWPAPATPEEIEQYRKNASRD